MKQHLYQSKVGFFDKLFHTYKWQIDKCQRVDKGWFTFAIKHRLDQRIELDGMDMEKWFSDPRLKVLLLMLPHNPDCDSEHMLSVLKAKMPEIMIQINLGHTGNFDAQYRTAMLLLEKKKDIAAALLLDILTAQAGTVVKQMEMHLQEHKQKLEAIGFWRKQPFMDQVDNVEKIKGLGNEQQILFYQKDTQGEKEAWEEHLLEVEFWRASASHNIYMKDKSNSDAKGNAVEAMNQFLTLYKSKFTSEYNPFSKNAEAISKFLKEEY